MCLWILIVKVACKKQVTAKRIIHNSEKHSQDMEAVVLIQPYSLIVHKSINFVAFPCYYGDFECKHLFESYKRFLSSQ